GPPAGPPPGHMQAPYQQQPGGYPGQGQPPFHQPPPGGYPGQGQPQYHQHQGPPPPQATPALAQMQNTSGSFEGCSYTIDHRDSNSVIRITLQPGYMVKTRPGSMVAMSGSVQIKGSMKFSFTKMMTGGEMSESQMTGPGEVILAPEVWGDIIPIHVQPNDNWSMGKDAYLACTPGIVRSTKSQGIMKGLMSGEGFFLARVQGQGILWAQSLGAIIRRDLAPGEQWIVDNGHLVAWSAKYTMERIATSGGGLLSGMHTGEGMVCRFTGPGTIYLQTRNPQSLGQWIQAQVPAQG
ncbi:DUF124-domain-containing protein, partial [Serendipita vermifera]